MTLESYLQLIGQLSTAVIFTMLLFSIVVVCCYYCFKMGEDLIKRRHKYLRKLTKSPAFKMFNEPGNKLAVVKRNGKAAAK